MSELFGHRGRPLQVDGHGVGTRYSAGRRHHGGEPFGVTMRCMAAPEWRSFGRDGWNKAWPRSGCSAARALTAHVARRMMAGGACLPRWGCKSAAAQAFGPDVLGIADRLWAISSSSPAASARLTLSYSCDRAGFMPAPAVGWPAAHDCGSGSAQGCKSDGFVRPPGACGGRQLQGFSAVSATRLYGFSCHAPPLPLGARLAA